MSDELNNIVIRSMATQIKFLESEKKTLADAFQSVVEERDALLEASKESCECSNKKTAGKKGSK